MKLCGAHWASGELITIHTAGSKIESIECGQSLGSVGGPEWRLAPGLIDIQVNGYAGRDFNEDNGRDSGYLESRFRPLFDELARAGVTSFCPTVLTAARGEIEARLRSLAGLLDAHPSLGRAVPGIHLEGPYIASEDGPRGAHPVAHARSPDWDEFQRFQEAAGGRIRICTLAPERPGAIEFIERLVNAGVVAAIGHTGATPAQIREAARAGARCSTHLGNGAHSVLPRHPNYLWEQLACDDMMASVIADGNHLPPAVLKCMARAKGADRLILVSDAVALGGLPPGLYNGGLHEVEPGGRITLAGTPYLAGAGHLMDTCVANAVRFGALSQVEAINSATRNPARLLGLEEAKRLRNGGDADLILFQWPEKGPLRIGLTLRTGNVVWQGHGLTE